MRPNQIEDDDEEEFRGPSKSHLKRVQNELQELGRVMTGMGDDGARGLREMYEAGAYTLGQDEATCVVYGMPKEARKLDAVHREIPLEQIPAYILRGDRP